MQLAALHRGVAGVPAVIREHRAVGGDAVIGPPQGGAAVGLCTLNQVDP
jgi:hypothetical protein